MDGEQKRTIIAVIFIIYTITIVGATVYLFTQGTEQEVQRGDLVTEIPETMLTFWNINDSAQTAYILEGHVINSSVTVGNRIDRLPIHTITIKDDEGNAHTLWMIFDMEPNTYFKRYHNPVVYDYYVQFIVQETEYEDQVVYRCFYYRQLYEYR